MAAHDPILATRTTTRLLDALHEGGDSAGAGGEVNEPAWTQMDARYRPVIAGLARRLGLNESAAEEVAQQTMAEFVRAYRGKRYDRERGRLSSWILGIAHNLSLRTIREAQRAPEHPGEAIGNLPDEPALRSIWNDERDQAILARALDMVRVDTQIDDRTLRAFELAGLRNVPTAEVALQCGMTADQVYVAKSRVTKRLRQIVEELTSAFEEDR